MIIQFPIKRKLELSEEHIKSIGEYADGYVEMLKSIAADLIDENTTDEELNEVMNLVLGTLMTKFEKALIEMDGDLN